MEDCIRREYTDWHYRQLYCGQKKKLLLVVENNPALRWLPLATMTLCFWLEHIKVVVSKVPLKIKKTRFLAISDTPSLWSVLRCQGTCQEWPEKSICLRGSGHSQADCLLLTCPAGKGKAYTSVNTAKARILRSRCSAGCDMRIICVPGMDSNFYWLSQVCEYLLCRTFLTFEEFPHPLFIHRLRKSSTTLHCSPWSFTTPCCLRLLT